MSATATILPSTPAILRRLGEVPTGAAAASAHADDDGVERRFGLRAEECGSGDDGRDGGERGVPEELAAREGLRIWICLHWVFQVLCLH